MPEVRIEREVSFDSALFTKAAVLAAAYRLSDRLSVEFLAAEPVFRCLVRLRSERSEDAERRLEQAIDDLRREVLDQQLRERVRTETEGVRNLILAQAFSRTGFVD